MLPSLKKRLRAQERELAVPPTMEGTQSSPSLQDPGQSPQEVPKESIRKEQPPGNLRTESLDVEGVPQHLSGSQDSLVSQMDELRTLVIQMNQWFKSVESRFSSLEARACETQQTNSIVSASQSNPTVLPAACSPSVRSHQIILEAAHTTASPCSVSADSSTEPAPLSSSEQLRSPSITLVYSETEEKALQMLADARAQERNSETAQIPAEVPYQQEDTSSRASPLITPKCETESQILSSTEETALPMITVVRTLDRNFESVLALTGDEESNQQDDSFPRAPPYIAPEYETDPPRLKITEEAAQPITSAVGSQESAEKADREPEKSDQDDLFSGGSAQAYEAEQTPLMAPQLPAPAARQKEAPGRATRLSRRRPTKKRARSSALTSPATSAGTLGHLASSSSAEERPPNKGQRTSIVRQYSTKFKTARCFWKEDVRTGKIGGCVTVERPSTSRKPRGTTPAATSPVTLSCLASSSPEDVRPSNKGRQRSIAWKYFTKKTKFVATCNHCKMDVKTGKEGGCGRVDTAALLSHLKCKHGITLSKVAPPLLPASGSEIQAVERPSTIEQPSRTTPAASDSADSSTEPAPLSSSEQLRSPSSTLVYSETEEKALQMLADAWAQERNSETAQIPAEVPYQQEDTSSRASPLITPKCETESQILSSTEETALPMITVVRTLDRNFESVLALTGDEESNQQDDSFPRAPPYIAPEYETDPPPLKITEEAAQPITSAVGSQESAEKADREPEKSDQDDLFSGGSAQAYEAEQTPLMAPQLPAPAARQKEAPGRATRLSRRRPTKKRARSSALTSPATSAGTLGHLASSSSAEERPPNKRQRTSIVRQYSTKFKTARCFWKEDLRTRKIGGCVTVERPSTSRKPSGTTPAATSPVTLSCLASSSPEDVRPSNKGRQTSIVWKYFTKKTKFTATCDHCKMVVKIGEKGGCGRMGTAALLSHLKRKHGITQ
ncbi:uncharacterized protein LOC143834214 isoform X1 [Paroedura picta]|uniref:uncharacterized protein LOC143834214 isoform X1 n=1 Tax=Paroedura picta TaxID=143630 RepID=UPI0040570409